MPAGQRIRRCAPGSAAPPPPALKFRLSNATVTPQNDGQATNFTADYVLESGTLTNDAKVVWVIHPAKGEDVTKPLSVRAEGKLRSFFKDVAADRGPFECYFALVMSDGSMQPVSDKVAVK